MNQVISQSNNQPWKQSREQSKEDSVAWLKIEELTFKRGSKVILDDINLFFYPGKHYILAGPNGAGKSTLLDIIANLISNFSGKVDLHSKNLKSWSKKELAKFMALAPQDYRINFSFTVEEMVSLGRRPYLNRWGYLGPKDRKIIKEALAQVEMESMASKEVTKLSGGEKQRALLARTLAQQTPILLLDEPTAGLDIAHALKMMDLAQKKAAEGKLVITVTHDLALATSYGDEFIFLKNGRQVSAGSLAKVLTSEVLNKVYDVESLVTDNDFNGGKTVLFKEAEVKKYEKFNQKN